MTPGFDRIVGTGGIGTGMLFHSPVNETLGRSESRLVELRDARDYCKLHIVFHYAAVLLSPRVAVCPIGYVGDDANGRDLLAGMREAGMDVGCVGVDERLPTVISVCLQYPDKEGCNFTASNGAGGRVTPEYVASCLKTLAPDPRTIVAAIPEVRVDSRLALLREGRSKGAYCVLSVPAAEAADFARADAYRTCDLLAVNQEEACAILSIAHAIDKMADAFLPSAGEPAETAARLYDYLRGFNPEVRLLMTCGVRGAYSAGDGRLEFIPSLPASAVNTTGAGDACLGGTLAGIALGLPFQKGRDDPRFGATTIESAVELGTLCAGMAIESDASIALEVDRDTIRERIRQNGWTAAERFI